MRTKTLLAAFILVVGPVTAMAEGCNWQHTKETANQCLVGQVIDPTTGDCVTPASG